MVALSSSPSSVLSPSINFLGQRLAFPSAPASVRFRPPSISGSYSSAEKTRPPHLCSSKMASSSSLYEVLGIPKGATFPEIKSAYRRLARVCHPDVVAMDRKDTSTNEFKKIHAAYSTLSDPEKRAEYDRDLFSRQRLYTTHPSSASSYSSASASMSGFSGYSRRTWETDQCW